MKGLFAGLAKFVVAPAAVITLLVIWLRPAAGEKTVPFEEVEPGVHDFDFPAIWEFSFGDSEFFHLTINKPMVQLLISAIAILVFFIIASQKLRVVPKKWQFGVEYIYDFIRSGVARDILGHGYEKHVPFLVGIFFLVLVNNWFGEFFLLMFPTWSTIGFTMGLVAVVFFYYVAAGVSEHGLKYFVVQVVPSGVPLWLYPLIVPLEILSSFVTRPITLTIRLFGNMFAGHLAVLVFVVGGGWLITESSNWLYNYAGFGAFALGLLVIAIELFLGFMQAYLFTMLTTTYIAGAVSHGH
jgi:F-type H+-transporting ATPase subunit a